MNELIAHNEAHYKQLTESEAVKLTNVTTIDVQHKNQWPRVGECIKGTMKRESVTDENAHKKGNLLAVSQPKYLAFVTSWMTLERVGLILMSCSSEAGHVSWDKMNKLGWRIWLACQRISIQFTLGAECGGKTELNTK